MTPLTLNVTQAAKLLGFSRWTVNAMCKRYELPWVPRGRKGRRILRADVERWLLENTVRNAADLKRVLDKRRRPA